VNRFSVRARERNVFPWGSSPGTRLGNALQTLGKRLADPSRSVGSGVALISECRFVRYSLAFQGITFGALWTRAVSSKNGFGTALEHQTGPSRGIEVMA
jgi:hypothetical protein